MKILTPKLLLLCLCAAACSKNQNPESGIPSPAADASLTIDIDGLPAFQEKTKSQTASEAKINSLTIMVYDSSNNKEWSNVLGSDYPSCITISNITPGQKTVCVCANTTLSSIPASPSAFDALQSDLKDNTRTSFVMSGKGTGAASADGDTVKIAMNRLCAKFSIDGNITTAFPAEMAAPTFDISQIYLGYAGGKATFDGNASAAESYYNPTTTTELDSNQKIKDLTVANKSSWTDGGKFNSGTSLYAYPNSGTHLTRILIKATYNGDTCYYPIDINSVENNRRYIIGNITITAKGTDSPSDDFEKSSIHCTVTVADWIDSDLGNKEF